MCGITTWSCSPPASRGDKCPGTPLSPREAPVRCVSESSWPVPMGLDLVASLLTKIPVAVEASWVSVEKVLDGLADAAVAEPAGCLRINAVQQRMIGTWIEDRQGHVPQRDDLAAGLDEEHLGPGGIEVDVEDPTVPPIAFRGVANAVACRHAVYRGHHRKTPTGLVYIVPRANRAYSMVGISSIAITLVIVHTTQTIPV